MDRQQKTALITGASGGIGLELAKCFARDQFSLVLVARDEQKLAEAKQLLHSITHTPILTMVADLSILESRQHIFDVLKHDDIQIDVLVNNAGYGLYGRFQDIDADKELGMLELNIAALTHLTKLFLLGMLERRTGKILNLASMAAFEPGPLMATYYASKAYVLSFSEALAEELVGTGVSVTALCPGPTATGFESRAGLEHSRLFKGNLMDAETVARIGYRGLMHGKRIVIPGLQNKFMSLLPRITPRRVVTYVVKRMQASI